jgi:hypothetical protein
MSSGGDECLFLCLCYYSASPFTYVIRPRCSAGLAVCVDTKYASDQPMPIRVGDPLGVSKGGGGETNYPEKNKLKPPPEDMEPSGSPALMGCPQNPTKVHSPTKRLVN